MAVLDKKSSLILIASGFVYINIFWYKTNSMLLNLVGHLAVLFYISLFFCKSGIISYTIDTLVG